MLAQELPLYKHVFNLVKSLYQVTKNFEKYAKINIGEPLIENSIELFTYIQLANTEDDNVRKLKHIKGFAIKFELIKTLLRLSTETKVLDSKRAAHFAFLTEAIGKESNGWKRKVQERIDNAQRVQRPS